MDKKTCRDCKIEKELTEFHNRTGSKDGKQNRCKICNISKVKKWQKDNQERYIEGWQRQTEKRKLEGPLSKKRANKYGLTVDELSSLLDDANGLCTICKNPPHRWLVIDHCHRSNEVRGVLCERCNQALGLFKDDIDTLENAIKYLNKEI